MKYIITETQYKKLLSEQETETTPASGQYGTQTKATTTTPSSGFEYGKQVKTTKSATPTTGGETTSDGTQKPFQPFDVKIFKKKEEGSGDVWGNYRVKSITKTDKNFLEVDLGTIKIYTDCGKLPKGDSSFKYGNSIVFSKELATKVGEQFGCKFTG